MTATPPINILVLDDEPFMLKLLAHILARLGFTQVTTYDSGYAALQQVISQDCVPDLILCDLNMPEMDGIEFVRKLVEYGYVGDLILVSGEEERILQAAEKLVQAHKITILGHLQKPVLPAALALMLSKCSLQQPRRPRMAKNAYSPDEVRAAIANGELVNYYQPKVATTSGEVVGVETLVRWIHPLDGLVFPDQFIGIAEEHGLIEDLTRLVLTAALAQARIWREAGLMMRVAVNVSMDNLTSLDFPDFVIDLTAKAGVPPSEITLEITESRLMTDLRAPLEILTRLRLKRFMISVDDFGTGNSSLVQLRDMPFNQLKIDRGFVHRAYIDDTLKAMYSASIGLAKQLDMEIVAEGVEDRDDWHFVRRTGCDLAQGYFIAKPMRAADLPDWIADWQTRVEREGLTEL
jgi:EAL domain-containing protein (putative c-di-GMP-specific phosphodiesterase class I)/FixJ family two-component response regulator